MKYVMAWTPRLNGSVADNEASVRRGLELFSKWQAPAGTTFLQFVGKADASGGFAVVETDDPTDLLNAASQFGPVNEFQIYPVLDIAEWAQVMQDGVEFRQSIS